MTATRQSIKSDLKRINSSKKGKIVIWREGQPEPPHNSNDIIVRFTEAEEKFL